MFSHLRQRKKSNANDTLQAISATANTTTTTTEETPLLEVTQSLQEVSVSNVSEASTQATQAPQPVRRKEGCAPVATMPEEKKADDAYKAQLRLQLNL